MKNKAKRNTFHQYAAELFEWIHNHTNVLYLAPEHESILFKKSSTGLKPTIGLQAITKLKNLNSEKDLIEKLREYEEKFIHTTGQQPSDLPAYTPRFVDPETYQININKSNAYRSSRILENSGWINLSQVSGPAIKQSDLAQLDYQAKIEASKLIDLGYRTKCEPAYRSRDGIGYAMIQVHAEDLIKQNDCDYVQIRELSGKQYKSQQLRHGKETLRGKLGVMIVRHDQNISVCESIPRSRRSDALIGKAGKETQINLPVATFAQLYRRKTTYDK